MVDFDSESEFARQFAQAQGDANIQTAQAGAQASYELMEASEQFSFAGFATGDVVTLETEAEETLTFMIERVHSTDKRQPPGQLGAVVIETTMEDLSPGEAFRVDGVHLGGTVRPGMFAKYCGMSWSKFDAHEATVEALRDDLPTSSDEEIEEMIATLQRDGLLREQNGFKYFLMLRGFARTAPILRATRTSADGDESVIF